MNSPPDVTLQFTPEEILVEGSWPEDIINIIFTGLAMSAMNPEGHRQRFIIEIISKKEEAA